jgi:hypothetical protein
MTMAATIKPTVSRARASVPNESRAAGECTDYTADDRAGGASNDGACTRADGNAFQCSGLGDERRSGEGEYEHSSLEERAHNEISLGLNIEIFLAHCRPTALARKRFR